MKTLWLAIQHWTLLILDEIPDVVIFVILILMVLAGAALWL